MGDILFMIRDIINRPYKSSYSRWRSLHLQEVEKEAEKIEWGGVR